MKLTDEELLQELKDRFSTKEKALTDYQKMVDELGVVNQKLQDSERLKSQFLSNIRNEINNPFASIMGLSRQLAHLEGLLDAERIRSFGSLIFSEAFDLNFQLKNIFAAADYEAGEMAADCSRVCIADFMDEIVKEFSPLATQQQVRLELKQAESETETYFCTDALKLQLVVGNLISNAIKFSNQDSQNPESGKSVTVECRIKDGRLTITVLDQGIGIDAQDQQRIFDSFTQLNDGMTKAYRGHGLGLSVVRAVLDIIEGEIQVQSAPEAGSLFTVHLTELSHIETVSTSSAANEFLFDDGEIF